MYIKNQDQRKGKSTFSKKGHIPGLWPSVCPVAVAVQLTPCLAPPPWTGALQSLSPCVAGYAPSYDANFGFAK